MLTALVIAAALVVGGCAGLTAVVRSSRGPRRSAPVPAGVPAGLGAADLPPALVSVVLSKCVPGTEAYEGTILDLAARGFLSASAGSAGWQITLPAPAEPDTGQADIGQAGFGPAGFGPAGAGLAGFEQQAWQDVIGPLRGIGSAPFEVLADACHVDVRGTWEPFLARLMAEARRRGISRPALAPTAGAVTLAGATTVAIAACAYIAARLVTVTPGAQAHGSGSVVTSVIAVLAFWSILRWLGRHDRLTAFGSALAGQLRLDLGAAARPARYGMMTWGRTRSGHFAVRRSPDCSGPPLDGGRDGRPGGLRAADSSGAVRAPAGAPVPAPGGGPASRSGLVRLLGDLAAGQFPDGTRPGDGRWGRLARGGRLGRPDRLGPLPRGRNRPAAADPGHCGDHAGRPRRARAGEAVRDAGLGDLRRPGRRALGGRR